MLLQLHVKSLFNQKDTPNSKPLLEVPPAAVEFVVGPEPAPRTAVVKSGVPGSDASETRLLESSGKYSAAASLIVEDTAGGSDPVERRGPPVIGEQQLEVISELIEKGNILRDKMVKSLSVGSQKR